MKRILLFAIPAIALIALLWYHAATTDLRFGAEPLAVADNGGEAIAVVNGEEISAAQFGAAIEGLSGYQQAAVGTEPGRRAVADQLVQQKVLAQEGRRRGLDRTPRIIGRMEMAEDQILAEAAMRVLGEDDSISDEELLEILGDELEIASLSQIVLESGTRAKADQIVKELRSGADFTEMVQAHSAAPAQGGDIGEVTRNLLLPNVSEAVFSTPEGGFTDPVQIGEAWHIFWVRERKTPDRETIQSRIAGNPRAARVQAALMRLREEAEVEVNEEWMRRPGE